MRLFTRNGYDFTARFPMIAAAVAGLPVETCLIDGEAIVVNVNGLSVFNMLRYRRHDDISFSPIQTRSGTNIAAKVQSPKTRSRHC